MAQATPQGQINVVSTSILDYTTPHPFAVAPPVQPNQGLCVAQSPAWISFGVQVLQNIWVMQWHSLGTIRVLKYSSLTQWLGTVLSQF